MDVVEADLDQMEDNAPWKTSCGRNEFSTNGFIEMALRKKI